MGKDTTPMVVALNPNRKIIVGFFNAKDVEIVMGAEGDMVAQAKTFTQKLTSPEVLWTAGGGAALGFALASLTGANKVTMTASFAVLGGIIGSSSSSEKTMGADGRVRHSAPRPIGTGGGSGGNTAKKICDRRTVGGDCIKCHYSSDPSGTHSWGSEMCSGAK
jgi:hypothetical protein